MVQRNRQDLEIITELCATGKIIVPIDQRYLFWQVPEALRYLGEGRVKGKIVITVQPDSST